MNFLGLHIAANSMQSNQKALDIIGQNIANAQVEGYSRQQARFELITYGYSLEPPQNGTFAVGSRIAEITRYRDEFLDANFRRETQVSGELDSLDAYLSEVAEIFTDESDFGLPQVMNEFWQSWNQASANPKDLSMRGMVIQKATTLAQSIRLKGSKMDEMSVRVDAEIRTDVDKINSITKELASINDQIIPSVPDTFETNILLDRRDQLLDQLSKLADVEIVSDNKGAVSVTMYGAPLVSNKFSFPISVTEDPVTHQFHFTSSEGRELQITGGALKGLLRIKEDYVPTYRQELDQVALGLINNVNALHRNGYGLDGATGLDFFSGTGASDISVSMNMPEHLALSVGKRQSTAAMNVAGSLIEPDMTLLSENAKFATAPDPAGGTLRIVNNGVTTDINWTTGDTLTQILKRIKDAGLNAQFDYNSQRVILSNIPSTPPATVTDVTGNFMTFTNLAGAPVTGGEPGDGANGINIFELASKPLFGTPPTVTINGTYQNLVSKIGFDSSIAQSNQEVQDKYIDSLNGKRQQVSGVSVDEELMNLMRYQRAYQASAKMTTVMNDMLESLLNMVR